jgi:hypothetical protein
MLSNCRDRILALEQEARKRRKRTKTMGNIDIVRGMGGNSAFHEDRHEECEPDDTFLRGAGTFSHLSGTHF